MIYFPQCIDTAYLGGILIGHQQEDCDMSKSDSTLKALGVKLSSRELEECLDSIAHRVNGVRMDTLYENSTILIDHGIIGDIHVNLSPNHSTYLTITVEFTELGHAVCNYLYDDYPESDLHRDSRHKFATGVKTSMLPSMI